MRQLSCCCLVAAARQPDAAAQLQRCAPLPPPLWLPQDRTPLRGWSW